MVLDGETTPRDEQVVVLAGGLATRLGDLAADRPKALLPVGEKAFLDRMLEPVTSSGLRRFHFCLGNLGERVADHLRSSCAATWEVTYRIETVPRGTAGALLDNRDMLDETFLLLLGDTYLNVDYRRLFGLLPGDMMGLMVLTRANSDVTPNVGLESGIVVGYDKSGIPGGWTDTGVMLLRRVALDLLPVTVEPIDLSTLFRSLIEARVLAGVTISERFFDIGTPDRYRTLIDHLAGRARTPAPKHRAGSDQQCQHTTR